MDLAQLGVDLLLLVAAISGWTVAIRQQKRAEGQDATWVAIVEEVKKSAQRGESCKA